MSLHSGTSASSLVLEEPSFSSRSGSGCVFSEALSPREIKCVFVHLLFVFLLSVWFPGIFIHLPVFGPRHMLVDFFFPFRANE